ncbi:D-glycero-beta-D-manno-heptose 1,7-bisphosphate 7-phosphatase [Desulfatitalea alkaliphila]|uniref:D,D-heptose 1,7-bisphosphate phosphatase n=1 Tax=Desulfatitalea alkaliphila TaxID=2929485 RepID=A0AA41UK13_9BACT|nr:D-glycero-beta-D-manno-heptose 1,7-bisphosphate 7-phosphatase [Desulfatitalea alkaliphila]MCJ8500997.1 D-glycero-beta-D-manno-heptose 1,7-bisphosphate 7-phosphatase [Desulfatitalea alkaliphila]
MKRCEAIFLDRDGVINHDSPDYIKSWAEFRFLPGSLEAIALLTRGGFPLIVITNQSIIQRGMVPLEVLLELHRRMRNAVAAAGGRIVDIFFCPHRPDQGCDCRKPAPGLIRQAARRHGLDPGRTVMIGDSAKDILCGRNAGCGKTILVRTGNGPAAERELADADIRPDAVVDDLSAAAHLLLAEFRRPDTA